MKDTDINFLQMIFTGVAAIAAITAAFFAYQIGTRQNAINETSLKISNFVEVFLMPQQVVYQKVDASQPNIIKWQILVKNVSSYPIYLTDFNLNGVNHDVGNSAIPNNPDSWYSIPIPKDIQDKGEFSLVIEFEDYLGKKYRTEGFGTFDGMNWFIRSKKRIEI